MYVTVEIVEAKKESLEITEDRMVLKATQADGTNYLLDLPLYASIDTNGTEETVTDRSLFFVLKKADSSAPYWPRLVKTGKPHNVTTDFGRWKDENEEDEPMEADPMGMAGLGGMGGMGDGFDFSQLAKMAGRGGLPMMSEEDEEEEEESEEDPYEKKSAPAYSSE